MCSVDKLRDGTSSVKSLTPRYVSFQVEATLSTLRLPKSSARVDEFLKTLAIPFVQ